MGAVAPPGMVEIGPDVEGAAGAPDGVPPMGFMPLGAVIGPEAAGAMVDAAVAGAAAAVVMPAGESPTCDAPAAPWPPATPAATRSGALTEKSGWVRFGIVGTAVCR